VVEGVLTNDVAALVRDNGLYFTLGEICNESRGNREERLAVAVGVGVGQWVHLEVELGSRDAECFAGDVEIVVDVRELPLAQPHLLGQVEAVEHPFRDELHERLDALREERDRTQLLERGLIFRVGEVAGMKPHPSHVAAFVVGMLSEVGTPCRTLPTRRAE
jgi:hypothetical protein